MPILSPKRKVIDLKISCCQWYWRGRTTLLTEKLMYDGETWPQDRLITEDHTEWKLRRVAGLFDAKWRPPSGQKTRHLRKTALDLICRNGQTSISLRKNYLCRPNFATSETSERRMQKGVTGKLLPPLVAPQVVVRDIIWT